IAHRIVVLMRTMAPFGMSIADAQHVKMELRRKVDARLLALAGLEENRERLRMTRTGEIADLVMHTVNLLRYRVRTERTHDAGEIPRCAMFVVIHMEERDAVVEIEGRPEPEE